MSIPESIAWLETSKNSKSPSMAKVYATTILGELERLSEALHTAGVEVEKSERLRVEAVRAHRALESTLADLEEKTRAAREEWDAERDSLERRLGLKCSTAGCTAAPVDRGRCHEHQLEEGRRHQRASRERRRA